MTARLLTTKLLITISLSLLLASEAGYGQQAAKKKSKAAAPPIPLSLFFGTADPPPKRQPANGYEEILFEYLRVNHDLLTKMQAAKTPPERRAILEQRPQPTENDSWSTPDYIHKRRRHSMRWRGPRATYALTKHSTQQFNYFFKNTSRIDVSYRPWAAGLVYHLLLPVNAFCEAC